MKADALKFSSAISLYRKNGPGVDVRLNDTEGPDIFGI